jgi:uncharacterized protein YeeX (DUF496 family)
MTNPEVPTFGDLPSSSQSAPNSRDCPDVRNDSQIIQELLREVEALRQELAALQDVRSHPQITRLDWKVVEQHEDRISDFLLRNLNVRKPHLELDRVVKLLAAPNMRSYDGGHSQVWEVVITLRNGSPLWSPLKYHFRAKIKVAYENGAPVANPPLELISIQYLGTKRKLFQDSERPSP